NRIAAALRSGKSHTIGVLIPSADRSFFSSILRGIEDELVKAGYSVIVCQTYDHNENEQRALETLIRLQVDGVLGSVSRNTTKLGHFKRLRQEGIPLILFDRIIDELDVNSVIINDFQGGYVATEHLIKQGCKRIAHLQGDRNLKIYQERKRGYLAALEDYKLPMDSYLIQECLSDIEIGRASTKKLLSHKYPPDAIFSSSDFAALGALDYCNDNGIKVPEEMAIVGFANEPFTEYVNPSLSSVNQFSRDMGRLAAEMFLEVTRQGVTFQQRQSVLQPELIVRASSKRI
ncbi:MAG: substrate-binding domain-containing protein, partial [Bacteroidota bacterium]